MILRTAIANKDLTDGIGIMKGTTKSFNNVIMVKNITAENVIDAIEWYRGLKQYGGSIAQSTFVIFETLCTVRTGFEAKKLKRSIL